MVVKTAGMPGAWRVRIAKANKLHNQTTSAAPPFNAQWEGGEYIRAAPAAPASAAKSSMIHIQTLNQPAGDIIQRRVLSTVVCASIMLFSSRAEWYRLVQHHKESSQGTSPAQRRAYHERKQRVNTTASVTA